MAELGPEVLPDEVAERARLGDRRAFAELYQRFWPRIYRHTYRMVGGDAERGRDLAQEAFTRAFAAIAQTPPGLRFRPWIYRIATNLCLNDLEKRRPTLVLQDLPDSDLDPPDARGLRRDERRKVWRILAALPDRARQVLVLRELDELDFGEIALILGTTVGNVQVMLHRARRRFAQAHGASISSDREPESLACREFEDLVRRYVEEDLDGSARVQLREHLELCAGCGAERAAQRSARALFAMLPIIPVPKAPAGVVLGSGGAGSAIGSQGALGIAGSTANAAGWAAIGGKLALAAGLTAVAAVGVVLGPRLWISPPRPAGAQHGVAARGEPRPAGAAPTAQVPAPTSEVPAPPPAAVAPSPRRARAPRAKGPPRSEGQSSVFGQVLFGRAASAVGPGRRPGSRLLGGEVLRTPGFLALRLGDKNVLRAEPGTKLRVATERNRPTVHLESGEIWVRRSTQDLHVVAGGRFEVDPQGGSARVRTAAGRTTIEALSNGVLARIAQSSPILILQRAQAVSSDGPSGPEPLPPPPAGLRPTTFDGTGAPLLAWDPSPGARSYRFEIARSPEFLDVESAVSTAQTQIQPVVPIGRHYWRVLAEDERGLRSESSRIYSFFTEQP
ncbi:MAG: sigma-70 family RNA polymerase sigma factor [Deltaproteobacteria bacterium]|nr:sigma-70 family RNA polymerase sigma factor [Deltaproteobacteria bacterium]